MMVLVVTSKFAQSHVQWIWGFTYLGPRLVLTIFFKNGPFPTSFCLFFIFSIQLTAKWILIFADDWIRTADLRNWKRPLYQLSHNSAHFITFEPWLASLIRLTWKNKCQDPVLKHFQRKFYATLIFWAFWLASQIYQPIRVLKN